ncbi:transmembrane protein 130 [Strix aluco]|uniref:transmembrane protein 130 n=1 Tax=Strix aluco TaxID=111821 RepID=UPI003DA22C38
MRNIKKKKKSAARSKKELRISTLKKKKKHKTPQHCICESRSSGSLQQLRVTDCSRRAASPDAERPGNSSQTARGRGVLAPPEPEKYFISAVAARRPIDTLVPDRSPPPQRGRARAFRSPLRLNPRRCSGPVTSPTQPRGNFLPLGEAGWAPPRGSGPGARTEVPQYRGRPRGQRPAPARRHPAPAPARPCVPMAPAAPGMLRLTCVLLLLGRAAPAAEEYDLEITNNGPITTGAQATVHASLSMKNDSVMSNLYHFNWIYAPLILIEKSEQRFNSVINVTGEFPGTFPVSVWVTHRNCWLCRPVARNVTVLQITEFITGNLTIAQIEDSRFITHGSSSSTGAVTRISFCLHDPSHYFKSASFVYNWDFGDGVYQITKEPFVYYNCSTMGNRTVHLKVIAEWEQIGSIIRESEMVQKTGDFTTALALLDAVKSINVVGSRETHVMENLSLSLHINGTPPLALCWLIKSECIPLEGEKCHLVVINGSCYNLSHTFSDAGQYCLSVRVENGVTMLQTYHEIKVWPTGIHPAFFVLLCIALVSVMLGLVLYTTFRSNTQQKDLIEVADFDFSPLSDKNLSSQSESGCSQICCRSCFLWSSQEAARESHELLHSFYKPVKMYTV